MKSTKNLVVNAALCDMTQLSEELLEQYESIQVNAACILQSARSALLTARYGVKQNSACTLTISDQASVTVKNGSYELPPSTDLPPHSVLIVNGNLVIPPQSVPAIQQYEQLLVNGEVFYPDTYTCDIHVNGTQTVYPASARLIHSDLEPDRIFILRARENTLYFLTGTLLLTNPELALKELIRKNVTFHCRKALVLESLLEDSLSILDEKTPVTILPDGCRILNGSQVQEASRLSSFGKKIYLNGDLTFFSARQAEQAFAGLEYLTVTGTIYLPASFSSSMLSALPGNHKNVVHLKGTPIMQKAEVLIDRSLLEQAADRLHVLECASVTVSPDVTPQLLKERLILEECALVHCPESLKGTLQLISHDVAQFMDLSDGEDTPEKDCVTINAAQYAF